MVLLAMRDAAIAGLGVASLPTFHSYEALRSGALEILEIAARWALIRAEIESRAHN